MPATRSFPVSMSPLVLIVFSHLRWGCALQRPQHLMSRLAGRCQVLFVEEPVPCSGPATLQVREIGPSLTVLVPHTPVASPGFHDDQIAPIESLLERYLRQRGLQPDIAWLCTPMALPLVNCVPVRSVVFDCMDDLAAFQGAPRQLRQRESALMKRSDLVLTGGPSLYTARRALHPNVHCLPNAVEVGRFAPRGLQAASPQAEAARRLQDAWPRPRAGFAGVIDERLDLDLVAMLADAHPDWSVVMAGPIVNIDAARLPLRPNLHWLGPQPDARVPYLVADWDLCLLPFAMNQATRCISPIETLEFMSGEKPVVSTAVPDVIWLYGEVVAVGHSRSGFVRACELVLQESPADRARRAIDMLQTVSMHSWVRSADSVHALLQSALLRRPQRACEPEPPQRGWRAASKPGNTRSFDSTSGSR